MDKELESGWLKRAIESARRELETWPQHMRDRVLGPEFEIRPLREKEQGKP